MPRGAVTITLGGNLVVRRSPGAGTRDQSSSRAGDQAGFSIDEIGTDFRPHTGSRRPGSAGRTHARHAPRLRRAGVGAALPGADVVDREATVRAAGRRLAALR